MPYCRKCGTKMEEDARYCPKCGFDNQPQTLVPSKLELDIGPRAGEKMFPRFMKAWWFIAIISVIVLGVIIFFMFKTLSRFPF